MDRVREFEALSPKWGVLIMPLLSEFRELCRRGRGKTVRARGDMTARKHNRINACMNSQRLLQHAQTLQRFKSYGVAACEGVEGFMVTSSVTKTYLHRRLFAKGKLVFSSGILLGMITTLWRAGPMPGSRWATQNKLSGIFVDLLPHVVWGFFFFFFLRQRQSSLAFILWSSILCLYGVHICVWGFFLKFLVCFLGGEMEGVGKKKTMIRI